MSKRIYELTQETTAVSTDHFVLDEGSASGAATKRITYADLCLNQPDISSLTNVSAASAVSAGTTLTAPSATVTAMTATSATVGDLSVTGNFSAAPYGGLYLSASGATTVAASATYYKLAYTSVACPVNEMTASTDGRLTYTGAATRVFQLNATVTLGNDGTGSDTYRLAWYKNGDTLLTGFTVERTITAGDSAAVAISGLTSLDENDFVELWIQNTSTTDNPSALAGQLSVHALN
jgi:hypothetical protein